LNPILEEDDPPSNQPTHIYSDRPNIDPAVAIITSTNEQEGLGLDTTMPSNTASPRIPDIKHSSEKATIHPEDVISKKINIENEYANHSIAMPEESNLNLVSKNGNESLSEFVANVWNNLPEQIENRYFNPNNMENDNRQCISTFSDPPTYSDGLNIAPNSPSILASDIIISSNVERSSPNVDLPQFEHHSDSDSIKSQVMYDQNSKRMIIEESGSFETRQNNVHSDTENVNDERSFIVASDSMNPPKIDTGIANNENNQAPIGSPASLPFIDHIDPNELKMDHHRASLRSIHASEASIISEESDNEISLNHRASLHSIHASEASIISEESDNEISLNHRASLHSIHASEASIISEESDNEISLNHRASLRSIHASEASLISEVPDNEISNEPGMDTDATVNVDPPSSLPNDHDDSNEIAKNPELSHRASLISVDELSEVSEESVENINADLSSYIDPEINDEHDVSDNSIVDIPEIDVDIHKQHQSEFEDEEENNVSLREEDNEDKEENNVSLREEDNEDEYVSTLESIISDLQSRNDEAFEEKDNVENERIINVQSNNIDSQNPHDYENESNSEEYSKHSSKAVSVSQELNSIQHDKDESAVSVVLERQRPESVRSNSIHSEDRSDLQFPSFPSFPGEEYPAINSSPMRVPSLPRGHPDLTHDLGMH
jgi:hypothetical protein